MDKFGLDGQKIHTQILFWDKVGSIRFHILNLNLQFCAKFIIRASIRIYLRAWNFQCTIFHDGEKCRDAFFWRGISIKIKREYGVSILTLSLSLFKARNASFVLHQCFSLVEC